MKNVLVSGFFMLFVIYCYSQTGESWDITLSVMATDTSVYRDPYNKAGVRPEYCGFQCDMFDVVELIPPNPEYLILYFPHDEISDPEHYWPAPCTGIYTCDRRPPTFTSSVWRFKIRSTYYRDLSIILTWQGLEPTTIPPYHSFWLKDLQIDSLFNLRSVLPAQYLFNLRRASSAKFDLEIRRNVIYTMRIKPESVRLRAGEFTTFSAYLYETTGDSFKVPVSYTLYGNIGAIFSDGTFVSTRAGNGYLVATYQIWSDTATIIVTDASIRREVQFKPGWNMFSLPVIPTETILHELFPGLIYVFMWQPALIRYNAISLIDSLRNGIGYFGLSFNETTYTLSGSPLLIVAQTLLPGWNMLGSLADTVVLDSLKFSPQANFVPPLYIYNPILKRYETSNTVLPSKGYWALVLDTTNVIYETRR